MILDIDFWHLFENGDQIDHSEIESVPSLATGYYSGDESLEVDTLDKGLYHDLICFSDEYNILNHAWWVSNLNIFGACVSIIFNTGLTYPWTPHKRKLMSLIWEKNLRS